jgi:hypothetical protein
MRSSNPIIKHTIEIGIEKIKKTIIYPKSLIVLLPVIAPNSIAQIAICAGVSAAHI